MPVARVVDRFDAVAITREHQLATLAVPYREGEHPVEPSKGGGGPFGVRVQDHLRIGAGVKLVTEGFELGSELAKVVDLTVVADDEPAVAGCHRLTTGRREVDDRQSAVTEPDWTVHPLTFAIGSRRWIKASVMRPRITGATGARSRFKIAATPHTS